MWQVFREWLVKKNSRRRVIASFSGRAAMDTEALVAIIRAIFM